MTAVALPPTAASTRFVRAFPPFAPRAAPSSINLRVVSGLVREVLAEWDQIDVDQVVPTAPAARPAGYPADEVSAVEFLRDTLRISQERVLASAGVAERTFFGWKQHGRRPRASSIGRLWAAVEAVYYLIGSHPNLAGWFADNPLAQDMFDAGQFDQFVQLELDWAIRTYGATPRSTPFSHLDDVEPTEGDRGSDEPETRRPRPPMSTVAPTSFNVNLRRDHG